MPALFDKLEVPRFDGVTAADGMAACEAWEDWGHDEADSFSEDEWDKIVEIMRDNYTRYFAHFEGCDV